MKVHIWPIARVISRYSFEWPPGERYRTVVNWFAVAFWACVGFTAGLGYVILAWCFAP